MVSLDSERQVWLHQIPALPLSWDLEVLWQRTVFDSASSTDWSVTPSAFWHGSVPAPGHSQSICNLPWSSDIQPANAAFWVIFARLVFCSWLFLEICLSFSEKSGSLFLWLSKILADYPGLWPWSNPVQYQTSEVLRRVRGLGPLLWIKQCFVRW